MVSSSNFLTAMNAYQNALRVGEGTAAQAPSSTQAAKNSDFMHMVEKSLTNSMDQAKASDVASLGSLTGQVEVTDLVAAVTNAELTLRTVTAIRDKVISAYQDIIKMPI